jgi:hypothetical protein
MYILNRLRPAMLMLPIFIPDFAHLSSLVFFYFLCLAEPFVLFGYLFLVALPVSCAHYGTFDFYYLSYYIICYTAVALAHGGANPVPTPAGLKLGG